MIINFKDKYPLSNSLSVFNNYKRITGASLEKHLILLEKRNKALEKENPTEEEIDKALDTDPSEIIQNIYYAMRCAAEKKELDYSETISEVEISDILDESLSTAISSLLESKKKEKKHFIKMFSK